MFLEFDDLFAPTHLSTGLTIDLQRQHVVATLLNQRQLRAIVNNTALENIECTFGRFFGGDRFASHVIPSGSTPAWHHRAHPKSADTFGRP